MYRIQGKYKLYERKKDVLDDPLLYFGILILSTQTSKQEANKLEKSLKLGKKLD